MDRMIFTALNGLGNLRNAQLVSAQNLANQNVPGFRKDMLGSGTSNFADAMDGLSDRAYQTGTSVTSFSSQAGFLDQTSEPLDVAMADEGYFYIKPQNGKAALSRRGDLRVGADGLLTDGAGNPLLDTAQNVIHVPPYKSIVIDDLGQITIEPMGGAPGEKSTVATLATVLPAKGAALEKSDDGNIRLTDGKVPVPNQGAKVMQGVLERSNVNTTEELIASIQLQRSFELNMNLISTAKDVDQAGEKLIQMPSN